MNIILSNSKMNPIFINETNMRWPNAYLLSWLDYIQLCLDKEGFKKQLKSKELILVLLPKPKARALNLQFRKKDKATDVLSFSSIEDGGLGELVFCPEIIKQQARENHLSFRDQLVYLIIHGVLHLLGFEHEQDEAEAKKMFFLQDRIFFEGLELQVGRK